MQGGRAEGGRGQRGGGQGKGIMGHLAGGRAGGHSGNSICPLPHLLGYDGLVVAVKEVLPQHRQRAVIPPRLGDVAKIAIYSLSSSNLSFLSLCISTPSTIHCVETRKKLHTDPWLYEGAWWSAHRFMHFC